MVKNRTMQSVFILGLIFFGLFATIIPLGSMSAPIYNARIVVELGWSDEEIQKPIVPRDEIKELDLTVKFRIDTGESFGYGLLEGYEGMGYGVIELQIVDISSWCSAVLKLNTVITNLTKQEETKTSLYININENAPAFGEGYIKIRAKANPLGFIKGFEDTFTLYFTPSYIPIIKINLPETNTKRVDPSKNTVFPIVVENIGNARTKVFFKVENLPEGWEATITDEVVLNEVKGSKATAYLTVVPPKSFGYHYDDANIRVQMIPARAENPEEQGDPLYATFTIQNRGFSSSGIEQILFIGLIAAFILIVIVFIIKLIRKRKESVS